MTKVRLTGPMWDSNLEGDPQRGEVRELVLASPPIDDEIGDPDAYLGGVRDDLGGIWHVYSSGDWAGEVILEGVPNVALSESIDATEANIRRICGDIADMLVEKNRAYGNSALNPVNVFSKASREEQIYTRIDDKLNRVAKGSEYPGDDTIKDLAGYFILLMIVRESE